MSNNDNDFSSIFFQNVTPSSDGNNDQSVDTPSEDSNSAINNNAVNNANTDNFAAGNTSNDSAANYSSNNSSADNFNMNQNTQQSPYAPNNMGQQSDSAFDQNMNSNQAYTDPAYNMNQTLNQNQPFNNVPPEPVKKPKKKAIFISIAVACVVLAIAIIGTIYVLNRGKSDKKSLADNKSLFEGLFDTTSPISKELDLATISEAICSGSSQAKGDFTIKSLDNTSSTDLESIGFTYDIKRDAKAEKASMDLGVNYEDQKALTAQLYADQDSLKAKLPEVSDKVYTVALKSLVDDMKKSPLFKDEDSSSFDFLDNIDIDQILGSWSNDQCDIVSIYVYAIKDTYPDDYKKIVDGITTQNTDDGGVTYTISEDSVKLFVEKLLTVSFENDEIESYIDKYLEQNYSMMSSVDEDSPKSYEDFKKETFDQAKSSFKQASAAFNLVYNGDLTFTVYKNDKGLLTGLKSSNSINVGDETLTLDFNITSNEDENPFDNMEFDITLSVGGEDISLNYTHTSSSEDTLDDYNEFTFTADNSSMKILFINSYDKTSGEFDSSISIKADSEEIIATELKGSFSDVTKGKAFTLNIDSLVLTVSNKDLLSFNGKISVDTSSVDISAPSGKECKILELSEDDLDALNKEFDENFNALGDKLDEELSKANITEYENNLKSDLEKDLDENLDSNSDNGLN